MLNVNDEIIFLRRAFGVPISLANRNRLRLQMEFDSETAACECREIENVGIKALSICEWKGVRKTLKLENLFKYRYYTGVQ